MEKNIENYLENIISKLDIIETKLDKSINVKQCLDGDELLDNQDLCLLLGVTKQTLWRYRKDGVLKYYMVNGKVYYKKSEIPDLLKLKRMK